MLEKDIERKACEWARAHGWLAFKFTSPSRRSVPDRLFVRDGRVIFIEFKAAGGRLTSGQAREIQRLLEAGAEVRVAYSVEGAKEILG
jgi:hypothetical protein